VSRPGAATAALLASVLGACAAAHPGPPGTVARARQLLEDSRSPRGANVMLRCTPRDAEVLVDGVLQGLCSDFEALPAGLSVGEGLHRIEVRREGFWPYTTYVEPQGTRATLRATLRSQSN
jgi:PEGA domain